MCSIDITVVFATYNGIKTLPRVVDALSKIEFPRQRWKVVAIDNNSTDGTGEFLRSFAGRLPIEVYHEPRQGKSFAMNRGLDHVEGQLAVLIDDDIIPEPDWLDRYWDIAQREKDYDVFGGAILPDWPRQPEQWILDWVPLGSTFAINENLKSGPVSPKNVWGGNSAFRSKIIFDGCRFDESIGPSGAPLYAMGNDTNFAIRAAGQNAMAFHCADARVRHIIREKQMAEDWIVKRAERLALGNLKYNPHLVSKHTRIAGVPYTLWVRYFILYFLLPVLKMLPKSKFRYWRLRNFYFIRGIISTIKSKRNAAR